MPATTQSSSSRSTSAPIEAAAGSWKARPGFLIGALLVVLIIAAYAQATRFDWVAVDDFDYVRDNDMVNGGLTWEGFKWIWHANVCANWHPVTMLTLLLDSQIYGLVPGGFHFTNMLIHIANTLLLFGVLRRMTVKTENSLWPCALVAAAFALHPLHVESVAWISERKDVLSGLFFMLTLWAYAEYAKLRGGNFGFRIEEAIRRRCALWYGLGLIFFALGLMSKPMLVTLPCVLVLLDWWPLQRMQKFSWRGLRASVVEKIPFFALTAAASLTTIGTQKSAGAVVSFHDWPLKMRLASAVVAYARYIGKMFVPTSLGVLYPHTKLISADVVGSTILLVGISLFALTEARKRRYIFVGWFLFVGVLFPVCGIAQVGEQAFADRFSYLPHIGMFMAIAWALAERATARKALPAIFGVIVAACSIGSFFQVQHWHDSETLFNNTLRVAPESSTAHHYLAVFLDKRGKTNEALFHFTEAVRCNPDNVTARGGLGYALMNANRLPDAVQQYEAALRVEPDNAKSHYALAEVYVKMGRPDFAIPHYVQTLQINPMIAGAHYQLGTAMLSGKQDPARAILYLKTAVQLEPFWTSALNTLSWTLATHKDVKVRDGVMAVKLAERAVSVTRGTDPSFLDTLAAAYAETGNFTNATYAINRAIQVANASGQTNSIAEFQTHLKAFEARQPWRE